MVSKTQQEFLLGALIGGAIGAAAALVLTPLSGQQIRRQAAGGFGYLNGKEQKSKATPKRKKKKTAPRKRARIEEIDNGQDPA